EIAWKYYVLNNYLHVVFFYGKSDPYYNLFKNMIKSENYCKLCGKLLYLGTDFILCFEYSTFNPYYNLFENMIKSEKYCKLCGKLLYQEEDYTNYISTIEY